MSRQITTQEFITKSISVHGDRYRYGVSEYTKLKDPILIECPTHGVFKTTPNNHIFRHSGCPACGVDARVVIRSGDNFTFITAARQVHGDKYDYSLVEYNTNHTKITILCPVHGRFAQIPNSHLNGSGCPTCYTDNKVHSGGLPKLGTDVFVARANAVHGDKYDYSEVEYVNNYTKVTIMCPVHGQFQQIPSNHSYNS